MNVGDKVYRGYGDYITPGIIVAKTRTFNPLPQYSYIVKDATKVKAITELLLDAFTGSPKDIHRCSKNDLIPMLDPNDKNAHNRKG